MRIKKGEEWRLKSDANKIATVVYVQSYGWTADSCGTHPDDTCREGFKFSCITVKGVDAWRWGNWKTGHKSVTKPDEDGDCYTKTFETPEAAMLAAVEAIDDN